MWHRRHHVFHFDGDARIRLVSCLEQHQRSLL
nr:MAG TPA: hypothetical protein [Caudoviricetes sp.]